MREDMNDVFHDRGKTGSAWDTGEKGQKRALQRIDPEDLPSRGSNHKSTKYTSYHSAPINRFLRSRLGQKWDEIYKEIAEVCDGRSDSQRQMAEALRPGPDGWFVEHNVQMIDGVPHDSQGRTLRGSYRGSFYVHPETKTLEVYQEKRPGYRKWKEKPYVKIDDLNQYRFYQNIWYHVTFKKYEEGQYVNDILVPPGSKKFTSKSGNPYTPYYWNNFNKDHYSTRQSLIDRYGDAIYPVSKLQCNTKEIKKIKNTLVKMSKNTG